MAQGDRQKYLSRRDQLVEQVIRKQVTIANGAEGELYIDIPADANVFMKGIGYDYFGTAIYKLQDNHRNFHKGSNQIGSIALPQQWSIPFYLKKRLSLWVTNSTGASQDYSAVFIIHTDKLLEDESQGTMVAFPISSAAGSFTDVRMYGQDTGGTDHVVITDGGGNLIVQLETTPTIDIGDVAIMATIGGTDTKLTGTTIASDNCLDINLVGEGGAAIAAGNPVFTQLADGTNAISSSNPLPVTSNVPTTLLDGSKATTSDTAVALGSAACRKITVQSSNANTVLMYVGNSTSQTIELYPGDSVDLNIDNLSKVYIKRSASTNVTANFIGG